MSMALKVVSSWWNRADPFDSTTAFLRQRGLLKSAQIIMAVVAASSALVPLSALPGHHPDMMRMTIVGVCAAVLTVGTTTFMLTRWPTRRQSTVNVLLGIACIAAWSTTEPNSALAALACTAMAAVGGYVAFFHGPKLLTVNVAAALVISAFAAVRIEREAGTFTAAAAFCTMLFMNVSVPLSISAIGQAMRTYATRSSADPLTGLLNRRAFVDAIATMLSEPTAETRHLSVHLVDLDKFKRINDTHGHDVGDRVLQAVADLLRCHAPPAAAICRAGGEEFLVASISTSAAEGASIAHRMCMEIARASQAITASIGSTTARVDGHRIVAAASFVEELITAADRAMYAAKRNGGNQVQHA